MLSLQRASRRGGRGKMWIRRRGRDSRTAFWSQPPCRQVGNAGMRSREKGKGGPQMNVFVGPRLEHFHSLPLSHYLTESLLLLRLEWCDSSWKACQLIDGVPSNETYQNRSARPILSDPVPTKPNQTTNKLKPNEVEFELLIELKHSRKQENSTEISTMHLAIFLKLQSLWHHHDHHNDHHLQCPGLGASPG